MGKVLGTNEGLAFYINWDSQEEIEEKKILLQNYLEKEGLVYTLVDTARGVILTLLSSKKNEQIDAVNIRSLSDIIGTSNIFKMASKKIIYRQGVFLQEVPWGLPLEELQTALAQQGMGSAKVERKRQYVRVEVTEPDHYESLLRNGLEFFNVARFPAIPDVGTRTWVNWHDRRSNLNADSNFVLQCYRCQGWWHTAANCRYKVRCVRCGGHHNVANCLRPRSDPVCCHCSGPHSASNRLCPVRLSMVNAVPISLTFSSDTPSEPYQDVL